MCWAEHSERRGAAAPAGGPSFGFPNRLPRSRSIVLVLVGLTVVGLADLLSGHEIWLGPAYLMVISFAAWSLGWREGTLLGLVCFSVTFTINGNSLYPFGSGAMLSNIVTRVLAVTAIIGFLDHARRACAREWLLARTDPLTGALNRKAFFELMSGFARSDSWTILAYADLDGLKRINDGLGHARGDEAIRNYARQVRQAIRKGDILARIGGDEFIVHMLVRDEDDGRRVAERLHLAMNSAAADADRILRCSVGVLILAPGPREIEGELRAADTLMYEAKQWGAGLSIAAAHAGDHGLAITPHALAPDGADPAAAIVPPSPPSQQAA
jgi:diguanylate cyclase (GGDEF)-like protein